MGRVQRQLITLPIYFDKIRNLPALEFQIYLKTKKPTFLQKLAYFRAPTWARTRDQKIMSLLL